MLPTERYIYIVVSLGYMLLAQFSAEAHLGTVLLSIETAKVIKSVIRLFFEVHKIVIWKSGKRGKGGAKEMVCIFGNNLLNFRTTTYLLHLYLFAITLLLFYHHYFFVIVWLFVRPIACGCAHVV